MTYNEDIARALCAQQQCDEDGVMCIVSRQAADEGAGLIRRLTASNDALRAEVGRLREALVSEREGNLWSAYSTGHEYAGEWQHCCMSDAEWLVRECGMDPYKRAYDAAAVKAAIPIAARRALATSPACQTGSATDTTCEDE